MLFLMNLLFHYGHYKLSTRSKGLKMQMGGKFRIFRSDRDKFLSHREGKSQRWPKNFFRDFHFKLRFKRFGIDFEKKIFFGKFLKIFDFFAIFWPKIMFLAIFEFFRPKSKKHLLVDMSAFLLRSF